jgi:hypothetical protein
LTIQLCKKIILFLLTLKNKDMTKKSDLKRTFAFLKDRNLFNGGYGKMGLKAALTRLEQKTEYGDRARHPRKKAKMK